MSARPEEAEEGAKSENAEMQKLEIGKWKTYRNCRASKPETRSREDRVGLPKAAPEGRALREQASSNLKSER
jgi:hypothetical protein